MVGGFDEVQEEAMGVFGLVVVERSHHSCVQGPVEKSAAVSPLAPVFHNDNIPGVVGHAESLFVNDVEP